MDSLKVKLYHIDDFRNSFKRLAIILVSLLMSFNLCHSQVSLDSCIAGAVKNYPVLKARSEIDQIYQISLDKNKSMNFPRFSISGQGKYQSDVIELDVETPLGGLDFPAVPHFQYNAALNATQVIYNGGLKAIEKEMIINDFNAGKAELDAAERELKDRVQKIYLEILLREKQIEVIELMGNTIQSSIERLTAGYEGGVVPEIEIDLLRAEKISLDRKYLTLDESRKALIQSLALICGMGIKPSDEFEIPFAEFVTIEPQRPEYHLYNARLKSLDLKKEKLGIKRVPQLSAFGQAGYGRPGLNMLSDKWQDFYIVGIQLAWVPWDYSETRREKSLLELNQRIIEHEREYFDLQLENASLQILNQIGLNKKIIIEDHKMVSIRENISTAMQRKLKEGVITGSEYLAELNKEKEARLELERSKLELVANILAYNVLNGKL
jgi:outer membrane protein TolC